MAATGTLGKVLLIRHIADGRLDIREGQNPSPDPPRPRSTVGCSSSRCERIERPKFCNGLSHSVAPDSVLALTTRRSEFQTACAWPLTYSTTCLFQPSQLSLRHHTTWPSRASAHGVNDQAKFTATNRFH